MQVAALGLGQMKEYMETGEISLAHGKVEMNSDRLKVIQLALAKCLPDMHHTEVQRTSTFESVGTNELLEKLAAMTKERPQLAKRLNEVLGGKLIEGSTGEPAQASDKGEDQTASNRLPSAEQCSVEPDSA